MSFMTGSNQSLMNCTRTSSNLGLTWGGKSVKLTGAEGSDRRVQASFARYSPSRRPCRQGVALKRKKVRPNVLTAWVAFFIATVWVQVAGASPTGLDAIPPAIETLYSAGSYSQGADALQAAIVQHPKDASLYYWLGRCYFEIRDFDRSISSWESAIDLDSTRSDYHDWLGRA
jgi:tetratricopeptide (TPR) repeat protein